MFVKVLSLVLGGLFAFACISSAAPDFSRPHYYLGHSNANGRVNIWMQVGDLTVSDGSTIPFRLKFTSEDPEGAKVFGKFWACPLVESSLFPYSEKILTFNTPGGRTLYLNRDKKDDKEYKSGDGRYRCMEVSPNKRIVYEEGWEYRFLNGKIQSIRTASGAELEWNYNGSRIESISERQKGVLLKFDYEKGNLIPTKFTFNREEHSLTSDNVPIAAYVTGQLMITGYEASMNTLKDQSGEWKFAVELDRTGDYHLKMANPTGEEQTFGWNGESGILKSDGEWTYTFEEKAEKNTLVSRKNAKGEFESYSYDGKTGISEHRRPDGVLVTRQYFIHRIPSQYKIRKLMESKDGKILQEISWSYDELGREIRVLSGDYELTRSFHPNGQLASLREEQANKVLKEELYAEDGKIQERTKGSFKYNYIYENGQVVVQQFLNGKMLSSLVRDPSKNKEAFLLFNASSNEFAEGPSMDFQKNAIDGKVLEQMKGAAIKALKGVQGK